MEVEEPPRPSRLFLVSLGVIAILLVSLVATVLVFRLQPQIASTCTGSCAVLAGTVVTMPSGVGSNTLLNFAPDTITVYININNTVIWQNLDKVAHTVTAVDNSFNSGLIEPGKTWNYTFTTPGNYSYYCEIHPAWMRGEVIVKQLAPGNLLSVVTIPAGTSQNPNNPVYNYEPDNFLVIIDVNNTVKFVNDDSVNHTVTDLPLFNSGNIVPGGAWVHVFDTPGTYTFRCIYHSWMVGTITVVSSAS